jgi:hypothetical protein
VVGFWFVIRPEVAAREAIDFEDFFRFLASFSASNWLLMAL